MLSSDFDNLPPGLVWFAAAWATMALGLAWATFGAFYAWFVTKMQDSWREKQIVPTIIGGSVCFAFSLVALNGDALMNGLAQRWPLAMEAVVRGTTNKDWLDAHAYVVPVVSLFFGVCGQWLARQFLKRR